jgi:hypothetical protein
VALDWMIRATGCIITSGQVRSRSDLPFGQPLPLIALLRIGAWKSTTPATAR